LTESLPFRIKPSTRSDFLPSKIILPSLFFFGFTYSILSSTSGILKKISIECDAPWWVVFSEDSDGVCLEPQTAPPDAQNLGFTGENYIEALFVFESLE
jgi:galactose mutarotase-like enzyme